MFISFRNQRKFHGSPTFDLSLNHGLGFQRTEMGFGMETGQAEIKLKA